MNGDILDMDPEQLSKEMSQKGLQVVTIKGIQSLARRMTNIENKLLDPDVGIYSRVAANTRWRKAMIWLIGALLSLVVLNITIQFI